VTAPVEPAPVPAATPVEPAAPTQPTPAELYEDEYWADLPSEIQAAYGVLLYNETAWNTGIETATNVMDWNELTPEMQDAALLIGYNEEAWCETLQPSVSPGVLAFSTGNNTSNEPEALGNAVEGDYDDASWAEMPPEIQAAFTTLGYDEDTWCMGGEAESDYLAWDDLSSEEQAAASVLGYSKELWDEIEIALLTLFGADELYWDELSQERKVAAGVFGLTKEIWDDDKSWTKQYHTKPALLISDDDYVFPVAGLEEDDIWVSQYQILYFVAALCFVIVGFVDLFLEKRIFHIAMIVAGCFGLLAAVFVEANPRLSNIFGCVSVHFFLLEAVTLFGDHKRNPVSLEAPKYVIFFTATGDLGFILGAFIDLILSYFYLFYDTVDWSTSVAIAGIFASVSWLYCSLVYLGLFFYDP